MGPARHPDPTCHHDDHHLLWREHDRPAPLFWLYVCMYKMPHNVSSFSWLCGGMGLCDGPRHAYCPSLKSIIQNAKHPNFPERTGGTQIRLSLAGTPGMFDPARNYTEPTQKRPLNRNYTATSPIEKRHAQQKLQGIGMACAQRGRAGGGGRDRV